MDSIFFFFFSGVSYNRWPHGLDAITIISQVLPSFCDHILSTEVLIWSEGTSALPYKCNFAKYGVALALLGRGDVSQAVMPLNSVLPCCSMASVSLLIYIKAILTQTWPRKMPGGAGFGTCVLVPALALGRSAPLMYYFISVAAPAEQ